MNLQEMMDAYIGEGLTAALASSRVCQDIVLKAIAEGPLSRNVTIKGGVVMRSITKNNRRATSDIDLDFIHYSLEDESIRKFVDMLNCIDGIRVEMSGEITELKHQDYVFFLENNCPFINKQVLRNQRDMDRVLHYGSDNKFTGAMQDRIVEVLS